MAISLRKEKTARFIPADEQDSESPAVFILERPTAEDRAGLMDMALRFSGDNAVPSERYNEACTKAAIKHLSGWENVNNGDGTAIPFPNKRREAVGMLETKDVLEIGAAIILGEVFAPEALTEDERKN